MPSPELHPPSSGSPFLIKDAARPHAKRALHAPEDPTFQQVLAREAPLPKDSVNAGPNPSADDALPPRDSSATPADHAAEEAPPSDAQPDTDEPKPDLVVETNHNPAPDQDSEATSLDPTDPNAKPLPPIDGEAPPLGPPTPIDPPINGDRPPLGPPTPVADDFDRPTPTLETGGAPQLPRPDSLPKPPASSTPAHTAAAQQAGDTNNQPRTAQTPSESSPPSATQPQPSATTTSLNRIEPPTQSTDAAKLATEPFQPASEPPREQAPPRADANTPQTQQTPAPPSPITGDPNAQTDRREPGREQSHPKKEQQGIKLMPAPTAEPTYRPDGAPQAAQQPDISAPKLATPQPAPESNQLTPEQLTKFRASLTRGFNAVLRTGGGTLSMNLTPPTLGKIGIEMALNEGRVEVQIKTANEQAHRLLNENLAMLRTTLESKGLKVDRLSVQLNASTAQSSSAAPAPNAQQSGDAPQQNNGHDASQGQSRGRSDQNSQHHAGEDRPANDPTAFDNTGATRGGASFAQNLQLTLDAVA